MDSKFEIADYVLNYLLKLGASYVEARLELTKGSSYVFKNGVLQGGGLEDKNGLGIRFLVKNKLNFVSTNLLTKDSVKSIIDKSCKSTKTFLHLKEEIRFSEEEIHKQKYSVSQKIKLENVSPETKIRLLKDIDKSILNTKINVPGRFLSLSDSETTEYLVTSEGSRIIANIPRVNFYYFLTITGKRSLQRYWQYGQTGGWESINNWKLTEKLSNEVKALGKNINNSIRAQKGVMDVICCPEITGIMVHESVGHPYEADRILGREAAQAGESFISVDMLGTRIGSEAVNVIDNPSIANSNGFYLFDSEGVRAKEKFLIKKGIINEFLHNRQTAANLGLKSNGSSRSSDYDKEPIVRMSNTFFATGSFKEEELIEEIREGVYIKNFTEWNIDDKRYNQKYVGAEAYLIKNGEIKYPIFQPVLEIITPVLWKSIDAAANNFELHAGSCGKGEPMQALPVWFGGPSIRLRKVRMR